MYCDPCESALGKGQKAEVRQVRMRPPVFARGTTDADGARGVMTEADDAGWAREVMIAGAAVIAVVGVVVGAVVTGGCCGSSWGPVDKGLRINDHAPGHINLETNPL
ncbi:uncharacterized protein EV422DRAFT_503610 [Fimicolochytrium jonesii]|uniref:uncharacterized protein n=1 Tax=Fimicolochytrium jonesii TaxID=1396493 RepID=UPI0022FF1E97|nr:uncharacterized protein EV422DRAFT_503610 [Fimicolochytrium jonesii]KAI8824798.1 hypothetical protein EV422DRAFT_503610 [Fimicolochytrium jonesii]